MNKIAYLRKCAAEKYDANDLESAAEIGEILLNEHWHNHNMWTVGYANDLFNLACVCEKLGDLERAAELFSDSARQTAVSEGEGLSYASRIMSLAAVFIQLGLIEPAFFMFGSVAAIHRREVGAFHPLYADSLYNLANAAAEAGRKKDAVRYHEEALKIRENEGLVDDIISSLHSIAFIYEAANDYEKAASYAERAMRYSAGNEETFAAACNYLAEIYESDRRYQDALNLYEQVLEITAVQAGREHSAYLNAALRRANLLALMERPHDALFAHEEVRDIFGRTTGTNHVFYANCLRGMAMLHKELGETARAESLILEAMKIRRNMSEDIMLDIAFLIRLYLQENDAEKALEALIYALMISGSGSPEFSDFLNNLIEIFTKNKTPATADFISSMEVLNDREKLRPILSKWHQWEKD
ncbi:MAG: tetratricopeptide repeat protein [Defluviitaleaceae bacterium]|nr:tetratricopeptide repeat protein [Defluviitaleaceae bacterium]